MAELVVKNIGLLATPLGNSAKAGQQQGELLEIKNAFVAADGGKIVFAGSTGQAENYIDKTTKVIDAAGALVTPGLVDAHTHLVFGGWRQKELALKLKGCSYLEILKAGGGILNTVASTRQAPLAELIEGGRKSLNIMLRHGTTSCEAKSGYGLTLADELKQLRAVKALQEEHPMDIVSTFMGAHAIPAEYKEKGKREEYIKILCEEIIPAVSGENLAEFCDVFCEEGVFSIAESEKILNQAKKYNMLPKIHADEIVSFGGAELAAAIGAVSADHLIKASDEGLAALAKTATVATLLPGTSFYLNEDFARAREMVKLGIPVAVATDFNPGSCPNRNLQFPMNLACLKYRLLPAEILTAVTLNAAAAIGRAEIVGSLEPGKQADILIWDAPDLDFIFYHYGINQVSTVIKKGKVIFS